MRVALVHDIKILAAAFGIMYSLPSHALNRDVRTVIKTATYGLVAGAAVGAVSYPMTGNLRLSMMAGSLGLYCGIALGIFNVYEGEDPNNPNREPPVPTPPWKKKAPEEGGFYQIMPPQLDYYLEWELIRF